MKYVIILSLLLAGIHDYRTGEIPDTCSVVIVICCLLSKTYHLDISILIFLVLTLFSLLELIGFGDVKLISAISLYVGQNVFYGLLISSLSCMIYFLITKKRYVYFGPYLSLGFILVLLFLH